MAKHTWARKLDAFLIDIPLHISGDVCRHRRHLSAEDRLNVLPLVRRNVHGHYPASLGVEVVSTSLEAILMRLSLLDMRPPFGPIL